MYTVLVKGILLDIVSKEVNLTELSQTLPGKTFQFSKQKLKHVLGAWGCVGGGGGGTGP